MSSYSIVGKDNLEVMSKAINANDCMYGMFKKEYSGGSILEFGAGRGEFINRFYKDYHQNSNIKAVEIDKELHSFIECKAYESLDSIKDGSIDYIYSSNVLEHIKDDSAIVALLKNKLASGGTMVALVPAKMCLYSKMDEAIGHFRRYEKDEFYNLFSKNSLKVEYYRFFDFGGFFGSYAYNKTNKDFKNSGNIDESSVVFYDKYLFPISRLLDHITLGAIVGKNLVLKAKKT